MATYNWVYPIEHRVTLIIGIAIYPRKSGLVGKSPQPVIQDKTIWPPPPKAYQFAAQQAANGTAVRADGFAFSLPRMTNHTMHCTRCQQLECLSVCVMFCRLLSRVRFAVGPLNWGLPSPCSLRTYLGLTKTNTP